MTNKGQKIKEKILFYLERNPDGLKIGALQDLIHVSRNSLYRYLEALEIQGLILKTESKLWILKEPIKPKTIPGYHYQAVLQGLKIIGHNEWDINRDEGKQHFKDLGKAIYSYMKMPPIDIDELRRRAHRTAEIYEYAMKLVQEAGTVEKFKITPKVREDGFPEKETKLAAIITFEGGYITSEPIKENGFAHYYILAGIFEVFAHEIISSIYGGRTVVNVIKIDEEKQMVDLGVQVFFDAKTPYIDPKTSRKIIFD